MLATSMNSGGLSVLNLSRRHMAVSEQQKCHTEFKWILLEIKFGCDKNDASVIDETEVIKHAMYHTPWH